MEASSREQGLTLGLNPTTCGCPKYDNPLHLQLICSGAPLKVARSEIPPDRPWHRLICAFLASARLHPARRNEPRYILLMGQFYGCIFRNPPIDRVIASESKQSRADGSSSPRDCRVARCAPRNEILEPGVSFHHGEDFDGSTGGRITIAAYAEPQLDDMLLQCIGLVAVPLLP